MPSGARHLSSMKERSLVIVSQCPSRSPERSEGAVRGQSNRPCIFGDLCSGDPCGRPESRRDDMIIEMIDDL